MTFPNWTMVFAVSALIGVVVSWVYSRVIWRAWRRNKAELAHVYAHRLVINDGGPPDRDTAALHMELWQLVAVVKYGGAGDVRPLAMGDGVAVWLLPPAGAVDVAAVPLLAPRARGGPPAD